MREGEGMVATNEEIRLKNICPICKKGYLYCSLNKSADVIMEKCTNCNSVRHHKDRRKTKR